MSEQDKMSQEELQENESIQPEILEKKKGKKPDIIKAIQSLEKKLIKSEQDLEIAKKDVEDTKDAFQRTLAEYDNFRKRTAKEKIESFASGKIVAVTALIPTLDVLEIALNTPCKDDEYKKGIEMVMNTAKNTLSGLGVEEIEAVGSQFDPNLHAAVMQETVDGVEAGVVTRQLQKGYKMGDKIIRPATVAVAQ